MPAWRYRQKSYSLIISDAIWDVTWADRSDHDASVTDGARPKAALARSEPSAQAKLGCKAGSETFFFFSQQDHFTSNWQQESHPNHVGASSLSDWLANTLHP